MRKIDQDCITAFLDKKPYRNGSTTVSVWKNVKSKTYDSLLQIDGIGCAMQVEEIIWFSFAAYSTCKRKKIFIQRLNSLCEFIGYERPFSTTHRGEIILCNGIQLNPNVYNLAQIKNFIAQGKQLKNVKKITTKDRYNRQHIAQN